MTSRMRVAVLGGGILGVSTAAALAKQGADVTLMTAGELASGASGRSLAWLNSFGMRSPEYHYLRLLGLDRYRTLAAGAGSPAFLRFDGGLTWASDGSVADHRAAFEHMRDIGYACEWLTAEEVSTRTPGVDPAAISAGGAIFNPQEGWVDLPRLIEHLAATVAANGGTIRTGAGHSDIVLTAGRVTAVRSGDGAETPVDAAVLATGADVPHTLKALGIVIPDATPIALLVRTPPIGTSLRAVLNTPRVAVRPTPDGALAMDSGWSEREVVVQPDGSYLARDETIQGLLEEASNVLEGHPRLTCASYGVGPKPIPGDGEPVLGGLEAIPGYYVAFTHSGATLGLIAGELLADEILNTRAHPLLDPYRPSRFA
ncbi:MAG TPA: FAD-binding oxidoreductase [Nocardioidaceae bacterium]|nr:FAD-binding oxidoreductase [Nocardioidaceae bacterium]